MNIDLGPEINALFASVLGESRQAAYKDEQRRAKADPHGHRKSTLFPADEGPRVRYFYAGKTKRGGHDVWFGWSTNRNVAGYFLCFRERVFNSGKRKGTGERDQHLGFRKRKTAKARALAKRDAWRSTQPRPRAVGRDQ
jgi:hypothetical protein